MTADGIGGSDLARKPVRTAFHRIVVGIGLALAISLFIKKRPPPVPFALRLRQPLT
ncbi:MAG: hypothetical protein ABSC08_00135 [Bryobacteraceae bacterium]|jgi:hypothetical protein